MASFRGSGVQEVHVALDDEEDPVRMVAVTPHPEQWQRMQAAYDACIHAGVGVPHEVFDFFQGRDRHSDGRETHLPHTKVDAGVLEVELAALPPDAAKIRIYLNGET